MITTTIVLAAMLFIPVYAITYMIFGRVRANAFARWAFTKVRNMVVAILRWAGRQVAGLANRNPLAAGIIVAALLLLLYCAFRGHLR